MALNQKEIEAMVNELDTRLERLRQLYDQYFLGYEKLEPQVPRKDVERRVDTLRREQIRNTALRFRFTVITQKMNTYQQLWNRTCRQIEEGTYKRHVQKAAKKFGPGAGKRAADVELDIDVDLGELEAEVASDMEAMANGADGASDDQISDEDRRLLRRVEAELRGEPAPSDTERPAPMSTSAGRKHKVAAKVEPEEYANESDDDDMPTNRPPASVNMPAVSIPKSPSLPVERTHTAAPIANARPNIRKTDPGAPRAAPPGASASPSATSPGAKSAGRIKRSTPPPFNPNAPVMPKVPSAPPPPPREERASASKIALPIPGRESANMRISQANMRLAPPGSASSLRAAAPSGATTSPTGNESPPERVDPRTSTSMRAALPAPGSSMRMPPGAQARLAPPGTRTSPGQASSPGAPSTSMRAAGPAPTTNPGGPASNPSIKLPVPGATARGSLPMPGGGTAPKTGDIPPMRPRAPSIGATNSKPPPPLPSSITQRGKQPSLSELAADAKDKEKK